jgi:hypothetical protein
MNPGSTWLNAVWEGHIGLSNILSRRSFLDSLLKDLKHLSLEIKIKCMVPLTVALIFLKLSSGPQFINLLVLPHFKHSTPIIF